MDVQTINNSLRQPARCAAKAEAPSMKAALGSAQKRMQAAKEDLATINRLAGRIFNIPGVGNLHTQVRKLTVQMAELERQIGAMVASSQRISHSSNP